MNLSRICEIMKVAATVDAVRPRDTERMGLPMPLHSTTPSDEKRFWSKVDMSGGPDACWLWLGYRNCQGYGLFGLNGTNVRAHRYAYGLANQPPAPYVYICHTCDNPPCCNPRHLYLGSPAQNTQDQKDRDRFARGERIGNARLTVSAVEQIRRLSRRGYSESQLGLLYGVHPTTIHYVVRRKTWQRI